MRSTPQSFTACCALPQDCQSPCRAKKATRLAKASCGPFFQGIAPCSNRRLKIGAYNSSKADKKNESPMTCWGWLAARLAQACRAWSRALAAALEAGTKDGLRRIQPLRMGARRESK